MPIARSDIAPEYYIQGMQTLFNKIYEFAVPGEWAMVATEINSTKESETYPALGTVPKMQELKGERKFDGVGKKNALTIYNKVYTADISIPRTVFQNDQYDIVRARFQDLSTEGRRFPNDLVFPILHDGATITGLDGKYLFADDHPGESAQDNNYALALDKTNLQTVITTMRKFKDEKGRVLGIIPDTLIVPPDLEFTALELLNAAGMVATGDTDKITVNYNGLKGKLSNVIVTPYLTSGTEWYVACSTRGVKGVILQKRMPVELTIKMDPDTSDMVYKYDEYYAGIRAEYGAGPGDWHSIIRGNA